MPEILPPRPYQDEAISAAFKARECGLRRFTSLLATGLGKTVIFSHLAKIEKTEHGGRTLILVHRNELLKQTVSKLHAIAPKLKIGVVGTLNKKRLRQWDADVVVASVATLGRSGDILEDGTDYGKTILEVARDYFSWITVDETHHGAAPIYQRVFRYFGAFDPDFKTVVAGYTATLQRADKLGLGDTFQENVFTRDIMFGIRKGYLVNPIARAIRLDIASLKGYSDYTDESVADAMIESDAANVYAHMIREYASDRQGIVFMPDQASATLVCDALNAAGIPSGLIIDSTADEERELIFKKVLFGDLQVLVNCMVLTEGFDLPQISFVIPRMTKNEGLFAQMVGRGLRPSDNHDADSPFIWRRNPKVDCLVLCPTGGEGVKLATIADLSETTAGMEIEDDETLIDLEERREKKEKEKHSVDVTTIKTEIIDLFASSKSVWLQTERGFWFIPLKDFLLVIYPEDQSYSTFMIGTMFSGRGIHQKGVRYGDGMNLEYAKAWGESVAAELDPAGTYSTKSASWKKKKTPPSDAQKKFATGLGIAFTEKTTKAELSDMISIKVATKVLDRYRIPAVKLNAA